MHSLVRRYLKTGIGFLALGLGLGLWMMADRELRQQFPSPYLVSAHTHAIVVGFAPWLRTGTLVTGILQVGGLAVFFYTMWSRIHPLGSQAREAQGERF